MYSITYFHTGGYNLDHTAAAAAAYSVCLAKCFRFFEGHPFFTRLYMSHNVFAIVHYDTSPGKLFAMTSQLGTATARYRIPQNTRVDLLYPGVCAGVYSKIHAYKGYAGQRRRRLCEYKRERARRISRAKSPEISPVSNDRPTTVKKAITLYTRGVYFTKIFTNDTRAYKVVVWA